MIHHFTKKFLRDSFKGHLQDLISIYELVRAVFQKILVV